MTTKKSIDNEQQLTAVWRDGGFGASYDNIVVGSSTVFRFNFYVEKSPLTLSMQRITRLTTHCIKLTGNVIFQKQL